MHAPRSAHPTARTVADVAAVAAAYFVAKQTGDAEAVESLIAPIWHGKHTSGDGAKLETHAQLIARIKGGPESGTATVTSVQRCFDDFAIVRADAWQNPATIMALMFKERGLWRVAGEASAEAVNGARAARFGSSGAETAVLIVLADYYRAVEHGDSALVRSVFAPCWHMKNHDEGAPPAEALLLAEETDSFASRIAQPLPGYWNDRQIADVQVIWDTLACVRVDRPSTPSTTVFLFSRERAGWKIIDKAWTDGRKASD